MIKTVYKQNQRGNALIYVLIAVALFAGLSFALSRQNSGANTNELDSAKAEFYATQLMTYAAQVQSVIDQMLFSGSNIDDLDFTLPGEAGFTTPPFTHKIYHPQGGGLTPMTLKDDMTHQIEATNPSGWYLANFNNVEWTETTDTDVMLTAHQISRQMCEYINERITGTTTIPALTGDMVDYIISAGAQNDLNTTSCSDCEGYSSLCVSNVSISAYGFYNVVAAR